MRFALAAVALALSCRALAQEPSPPTPAASSEPAEPTPVEPTTPTTPVEPTTPTTVEPTAPTTPTTVEPTAPTPVQPTAPTPPLPPPTTQNEPQQVDGWTLLELRSGRRAPDGSPSTEACGYERDVSVQRNDAVYDVVKAMVLVVPCIKGSDGLPVAGTPSLREPGIITVAAAADIEVGITGSLAQAGVVALVLAHRAELDACHSAGTGGSLVSRIVVNAAGVASEAGGKSGTLHGSAVDRCVAQAVKSWAFARPGDGRPAVVSLGLTYSDKANVVGPAPLSPPVSKTPVAKAKDQRPCAHDEEPKAAADLAAGELACKPATSERGVAFLKGELTHLGDVQLVNARTSFGVGLGLSVIDSVYYAVVRPDLNLRLGEFGLGLGAPLRFELANLGTIDVVNGDPVNDIFGNAGRFRTQDWDQLEDFLRPLRYFTYGKKEDHLYIDINRVHATTIGHGQLVRRYAPNLDIDEDNLFAQVDGYGDFGGVEMMAGPFPLPRLVGGLVFIKPMGIAQAFSTPTHSGSYLETLADSWSVGASYVTDLNAPTGLEGRFNPADQRFQLAVDASNQLVWRNKQNPIGDVVQGIGFDTEVKVLKIENVDVKVYGDYSHLFFPADSSSTRGFESFDGGGASVGGLLRVSLGQTPVRDLDDEDEETKAGRKTREHRAAHAFRVRLEGRTFAPTYLPSYWNTLYEVDRFQFGFSDNRSTLPTKIGYLAAQANASWRAGYYLEASYAWVDAVGVTAAFEDAFPLGDAGGEVLRAKNFALHIESQGLGWLQLFASYHFRNVDNGDVGKLFSFATDNELLYAGARLQVLPVMFINVAAQRSFRLGFDDDDSPGQLDDKGQRFTSVGLQNVWAGGFDVELGWQF